MLPPNHICINTGEYFIGDTIGVCARSLRENRPRLWDVHGEEAVISGRKREHVCRLSTWIIMQDKKKNPQAFYNC